MKGYYKQPKTTAENLTEEGWLMTGDIAEWQADGSIKIIDRKKNLVKLSHGEYVALEKLEAQYKTSKYVLNMCVHADPLESKIVAVIVPIPAELAALQKELGVTELNDPKVLKVLGEDFAKAAKSADFKGAEILKTFLLVEGEWTAENEMLTAAQKVRLMFSNHRSNVRKLFNTMYLKSIKCMIQVSD
jgi:long-chain acyl-CoA synthetase